MENNKNQEQSLSVPDLEKIALDFWNNNNIFDKSIEKEAPRGDYIFYDGPPFATGTPHYGHIVGQILKDLVPRFFTMNGYRVDRKWGWDCHGLPIENIVEKEMGTKSKKSIEELGIEKFNNSCRSKVLEYSQEWYKISDKLGRFVDKKNAYHTMDLDYMESIWWVFKTLFEKDLIYKDYRSMHVCPRCETTLSQSEVAEGYQNIKDLSCIAKFPLLEEENTFVLAWTTTPWTLIANTALAVGEDVDYVKISCQKEDLSTENYILAKERLADVLKDKKFEIIKEFKGKDLLTKKYKALFDYYINDEKIKNKENSWMIYSADFVNTEDGTGVVHIAPAFGQDDMNLGKDKNLAFIQHVGIDGFFKEETLEFEGLNVKPSGDHMTTDIEIIKYLAGKNLLFSKEKYEHSYPHCWRCDTPLINYATSSWFIAVTKIKKELLEEAAKINWSPDYIKDGRFGNWLEGARDWSISRQRFWASPLPIWECACGERKVIGSIEELERLSGQKINDIHKDIVDEISFSCPTCSGKMKRIPDVLDCWFESASMPYAQLHYPFENKEKFENNFPAEFIAEGIDQTRAWFYYLHVISVALFGKNAFKNVIVNGMVLAEDGKKMSKKLKNYPDPLMILDKYGADALRAYLFSSPVVQAENFNFSEKGVEDALRKNIMLINNIYNFYQMYSDALIEENYEKYQESKNILDLWILEKLNILIFEVESLMNSYNPVKAMRAITVFIDELSNWYLRRSRDRLKGDDFSDKIFALSTMRFIFIELSKTIAPFMPFISESLWQRVMGYNFQKANKSVHLEKWPESKQSKNNNILDKMEFIRSIIELGLSKRDEVKIKVRQILNSATIIAAKEKIITDQDYIDLIKEELNVKSIKWQNSDDTNLLVNLDTEISPELKREGLKRDLIRLINMLRKELGLSLVDKASLVISSNDPDLPIILSNFYEDLKKETLSENIILNEELDHLDIKKEFSFNDNKIIIGIKKI